MSWSLRLCLPLDATLENALLVDIASAVYMHRFFTPLPCVCSGFSSTQNNNSCQAFTLWAPASLAGFSEVRKLQFKCISLGFSPLYASRVLCVFFALVTGYLLAAYPSAPAWSSLDWFVSTANTRRLSLTPHNTYHFSFKRLFSATFPPGSHALCWYCFVRDDCRC